MSVATKQVVTHRQRKVITLRSQVGDQTGLADAVRAMNSLATDQLRQDSEFQVSLW